MSKNKKTKELFNLNIVVTLLIIIANIITFFIADAGKDNFIKTSFYLNGIIFFIYLLMFSAKVKTNISELKKEALDINYPINIGVFLFLLLMILVASSICLVMVNKEAANATFIFTFFMTTISMLFPSVLLGVFIYFITPALIIPGIDYRQNKKSSSKGIIKTLFILFLIFCIYNIVKDITRISNIQNQERYKSAKLTVNYSTDFLKLDKISPYAKKKILNESVTIPFFYTEESVPQDEYYEAENFCRSMDAKVPNYLEIYHIIFNKFDTFGEKYYWTSNKDGNQDLVLHFKNMSYEIIKRPKGITPNVYCVARSESNYGFNKKAFFYRNIKKEKSANIKEMIEKPFDLDSLKDFAGIDKKEPVKIEMPKQEEINTEKKHVNFSVKEVTPEVFRELLQRGYSYSPAISINPVYETTDSRFNSAIRNNTNNIRLCFYPFTEYGNLSIGQEAQIWKQSFCSPAFDLLSETPVLKSRYEKDSYCYSHGGKVPNIPELNGILRTLGVNYQGKKYWVNARVGDINSNAQLPVYVEFQDSRFMHVKTIPQGGNESANLYCIKNPQIPSKVIANYKSRFKGEDGAYYAKEKCPTCQYYEVPDTILQK